MKLRSKLLFSFIAISLVLVLGFFFTLRWSFERGAETFMRQQDKEQLSQLATALGDYYSEHGNWDRFTQQPHTWQRWLSEQTGMDQRPDMPPPRGPEQMPRRDDFAPPQPGSPPGPRGKPFFLLDANHTLIAGNGGPGNEVRIGESLPVRASANESSEVIGYIGLPPRPARLDAFRRNPIAAQQGSLFVYLTLAALLVSFIAAFPLSAQWSRRILQLHHYVGNLRGGDYGKRLTIQGKDEIAALANNLNDLSHTLEQAQTQRQQLTADISHELRTPVANLQAGLEAMQDGILPLNDESLQQQHEQVQRLRKLIDDLYQLSLADAGALHYSKGRCELRPLLEDLYKTYQPQFAQAGIALSIAPEITEALTVWGDADRLKQLFDNLLQNSLRYTNNPGRAELTAHSQGEQIHVTLKDSSPGVDASLHARLTDRLFRVDESRSRASGGAGLGLNLCAAIAQAHGGSLHFDNSELGGLAVTVTLPKAG